ncbi:DMT family protein [Desulfovibrio sp. OttesenSCG-928-F07]|nr:DMT family protein [Desulfovibrio sp. OttesenSCG-928-F07]
MPTTLPVPFLTIGLLVLSNLFMTFAWYGHLKFPAASLWRVILISWLIAFFEYCLQVPANRYGFGYFKAAELKTIQEVISLSLFMAFAVFYLGEPLKWNYILGFGLIMLAAFVIFHEW